MFESSSSPPASRRGATIAVALAVAAIAALSIGLALRGQPTPPVIEASSPPPTPTPSAPRPPPRLALPGMSLEAPSEATPTGDYVTGSVQATSPIEWTVTWQRGPLPPAEALQRIVETMARALETQQGSPTRVAGSREIPVGGLPGRQYDLLSERGFTIIVTFVECGGRVVQILGGGPASARALTSKMVESFQCTPDASRDVDREAVAVALQPGWQRTAPTGAPMLVNAREVLVRPTLLTAAPGVPLERYAPMAIRSGGFTIDSDTPEERAGRKLWRGSVKLSGGSKPAAVIAWQCPDDARAAAIYVVSMAGAPLDEGIALALTGRCLGADEKPPAYPVRAAR